jgi:cytochrome P450
MRMVMIGVCVWQLAFESDCQTSRRSTYHLTLANHTLHFPLKLIIEEVCSPLAKLPGMWSARLCSWIHVYNTFFRPDRGLIQSLLEKKGPIVRTGINSVAISCPDMIRTVYMSYRFPKGATYDAFGVIGDNIFATRDQDFHKRQKRLMMPAYSHAAVLDMEPLVRKVGVQPLLNLIRRRAETKEPIDLIRVLQLMTFDIIGEIGFGKTFGMLETGELHPILDWINAISAYGVAKYSLGKLFIPYLFKNMYAKVEKLRQFAYDAVQKRKAQPNTDRRDTLQRLLDAVDEETGESMPERTLIAEAVLQIVAGTDTSALTMCWVIYFLNENPHCLARLREEILAVAPDLSVPISYATLRDMPYLDAVIQEAQRLRPIVPHAFTRTVPKEGVELGGYFIPGGTTITASIQTLQMNKDVFPDPTAYKPERWLTTEEKLTQMRRHFMPFMIGPRACIGRALALMEIRVTIAELVRHFDFEVPDHLKVDMTPVQRFLYRPKGDKYLVIAHCRE